MRARISSRRARGVGVAPRIEPAGRLDHARDQRALRGVERGERAIEVHARGGRDAVRVRAEEDQVRVDLEHLALRPALLDLVGEQRLAHLAARAPLAADLVGQEVARDLLRDRRRALDDAAGLPVDPRGAHHRGEIEAAVLEEAHVLGGEDRLHQARRQIVDGDELAVADVGAVLERQLGEQRAVGGDDARRARHARLPRGEVRHRRQVVRPAAQQRDRDQARDDRHDHEARNRGEDQHAPPRAAAASVRDDHLHDGRASNRPICCGGASTRARAPSACAIASARRPVR
jgi:hypothetical protein